MKLEDRKKQFRIIYEELTKDFRVYIKSLAKALQTDGHTASRRLREALEKGYIFLPQLRRMQMTNRWDPILENYKKGLYWKGTSGCLKVELKKGRGCTK